MATSNFYQGADYGIDPKYDSDFLNFDVRLPASSFGLATDPRTANQIQTINQKLNTGAKIIEVSGVSDQVLQSIPKQHFREINRLKKLTGVDLTFHGPLVEPTGLGEKKWDPALRKQAERQILHAVERAHELDPKGNVVVTLHASLNLPEPVTRTKNEEGKEIISNIAVIDERTGSYGILPQQPKNYLLEKNQDPYEFLKEYNKKEWSTDLSNTNFVARRGIEIVERFKKINEEKEIDVEILKEISKDENKWQEYLSTLEPDTKKIAESFVRDFSYANINIQDAYTGFQELYNKAYDATQRSGNKEDLEKLKKLQKEIVPIIKDYEKNKTKVIELAEAVTKGIRVLGTLSEPPPTFQPIEKFAIDKASETFANVAFEAYKKFGETAPIIGIENPPAGGGLNRAEDLRKLIETTREKFTQMLVEKEGISEKKAEKEAEKLIGATWDVGHINMIRKFGYDEKDIIKESEKIAPLVKHVHLSDNFGLEHTEIPMGMGNVPIKKIMELHKNFQEAKKVIETGNWFEPFKRTPFTETLRAFGSPIYAMTMSPYWNQASAISRSYFAGYGATLPDTHFTTLYGAGFSNLPQELGGQISGRSRMSGNPLE